MTKYKLILMLLFLLVVSGCTDSVETVTREYRAANNECIDALMMVTNEAQAKQLTIRIFKPMESRYGEINRKLGLVKLNRSDAEFVKECYESDSLHLYLTDLQINAQRLTLEMLRIRRLVNALVEREEEALRAAGDANPKVHPKDICPFLLDLVHVEQAQLAGPMGGAMPGGLGAAPPAGAGGAGPPLGGAGGGPGGAGGAGMGMVAGSKDVLKPLVKQLFDNELLKMMAQFPTQKVKDYDAMHEAFKKRRANFLPKDKIVLVN